MIFNQLPSKVNFKKSDYNAYEFAKVNFDKVIYKFAEVKPPKQKM